MLTIGKTSEESPISLTTILTNCAKIGRLALLLVNMRRVVSFREHASDLMAGKNKSIIHFITKQNLAKKLSAPTFTSAPSIIPNMIDATSPRIS